MSSHLSSERYEDITKAIQRTGVSIHDLTEEDLHSIRVRVANSYQVFPGQAPPSPQAQRILQILQRFQVNLLTYREFLRRSEGEPDEQQPVSENPLGDIGDILEETLNYVGQMQMQVIKAIFGYLSPNNRNAIKFQYVLEHYDYMDLADRLVETGISDEHFFQYIQIYHKMTIPRT